MLISGAWVSSLSSTHLRRTGSRAWTGNQVPFEGSPQRKEETHSPFPKLKRRNVEYDCVETRFRNSPQTRIPLLAELRLKSVLSKCRSSHPHLPDAPTESPPLVSLHLADNTATPAQASAKPTAPLVGQIRRLNGHTFWPNLSLAWLP
jgi:hypothetical protein